MSTAALLAQGRDAVRTSAAHQNTRRNIGGKVELAMVPLLSCSMERFCIPEAALGKENHTAGKGSGARRPQVVGRQPEVAGSGIPGQQDDTTARDPRHFAQAGAPVGPVMQGGEFYPAGARGQPGYQPSS
jgi:hypothetical protein